MKSYGTYFLLLAAIIFIGIPYSSLSNEPSFEGQDAQQSEQIIFEIDGVNAAMHNTCPDESQGDQYDQDTDESYEDDRDSDRDADEDDGFSYTLLSDDDEEDDEADLDDESDNTFAQSLKQYRGQQTAETTTVVEEAQIEQARKHAHSTDLEVDLRTHIDSGEQIQDASLLPDKDSDQTCPEQENTSTSVPAPYCMYPYDLMDYIQMAVLRIQRFLLSLF